MEDKSKKYYCIRYEGICFKEVVVEADEGFRGMERTQRELLPATGYSLSKIRSISVTETDEDEYRASLPGNVPEVWALSRKASDGWTPEPSVRAFSSEDGARAAMIAWIAEDKEDIEIAEGVRASAIAGRDSAEISWPGDGLGGWIRYRIAKIPVE